MKKSDDDPPATRHCSADGRSRPPGHPGHGRSDRRRPAAADSLASAYLQYSAWADLNGIDDAGCVGTAGMRRSAVATEHTAFRCRVTRGGKPAGVVIATALGPEWFKVTRMVSGSLKPDRAIGAVPQGRLLMDSDDANQALERSSWARAHDVDTVYCLGVGPYKEAPLGNQFGAFSCATLDTFAQRSGTVLVQVVSSSALRVVKKLA